MMHWRRGKTSPERGLGSIVDMYMSHPRSGRTVDDVYMSERAELVVGGLGTTWVGVVPLSQC